MSAIRAHVKNGRLVVDLPTHLPEGTVLDLVVDDEGDELNEAESERLHRFLVASHGEVREGHVVELEDVLRKLRTRG